MWRCFAARGTGAFYKIDGIMRKETNVDILKQHQPSARKSKFGCKLVLLMDNDPKNIKKKKKKVGLLVRSPLVV